MNWKALETQGRVDQHRTSKSELDGLRKAVARNLADASVVGLSDDGRFGVAYEAALLLAKMAVACAGYRVKGQGQHLTMFQAVVLAVGNSVQAQADYFDRCRRKRNVISYQYAGAVTGAEADDLLAKVRKFEGTVETWIAKYHPGLAQ